MRCWASTDRPRWPSEGTPCAPAPTACARPTGNRSPWGVGSTALPAPRHDEVDGTRVPSSSSHHFFGGESPSSPAPVVHLPPRLAGDGCGRRPACLPAAELKAQGRPHGHRSSDAALGSGQTPGPAAKPLALPPAPAPAERTPMESQLGAARSAAGAFRAAAGSTSSSSPALSALSLTPLLGHPALPFSPRGGAAPGSERPGRRAPPPAAGSGSGRRWGTCARVRGARDVKETVMCPLPGGADPAGLEVSPAFLPFSLLV